VPLLSKIAAGPSTRHCSTQHLDDTAAKRSLKLFRQITFTLQRMNNADGRCGPDWREIIVRLAQNRVSRWWCGILNGKLPAIKEGTNAKTEVGSIGFSGRGAIGGWSAVRRGASSSNLPTDSFDDGDLERSGRLKIGTYRGTRRGLSPLASL